MRRIRTIARVSWLELLRRKDIYVLLILLGTMLFALISMNIFGLGSVVGYVKDASLLATWIFGWVLIVNCASRQLPQEEARGTILPLLAKPINRGELIVGKWLGAWSAVATAVFSFYLLSLAIVRAYGGHFDLLTLAQALILHIAALGIIAALAVALSTRLNQDAAATLTYVASAAMFLVVPQIPQLAINAVGWRQSAMLVLYAAMPHFELFDMRRRVVHQFGTMPWITWSAILLYAAILTILLLLMAWLGYHTRHFSRSNQD